MDVIGSVASVRSAPTPVAGFAFTLRRAFWVKLGCCLFLAGCATPPPVSTQVTSASAQLRVINLTDYAWRIEIVRMSGELAMDFRVDTREPVTVDLAGGDYCIKQTVLSEGAAKELEREIPAKFEAGQTYHWRLVTLLSQPAEVSVLDKP